MNVQPARMQPMKVQPVRMQPMKVQPARMQPMKVQPARMQPMHIALPSTTTFRKYLLDADGVSVVRYDNGSYLFLLSRRVTAVLKP